MLAGPHPSQFRSLIGCLLLALSLVGFSEAQAAPGVRAVDFASLLTPDVARRLAHDMSTAGAIAAGLKHRVEPEDAGTSLPRARALPAATQVIGGTDIDINGPELGAQNETSIAANPNGQTLVAVYDDWQNLPTGTIRPGITPFSIVGTALSTNGGASWFALGPLPSGSNGEVYGEPDVKYDPTRDVFISSFIFRRPGDAQQGVAIAVSAPGLPDGWSNPIEVPASFALGVVADKPSIDINPVTGRLIVAWTSFSNTGVASIVVSYSDDAGSTWDFFYQNGNPVLATGSASVGVQAPILRILPNFNVPGSSVFVAWSVTTDTTRNIGASLSTDDGFHWGPVGNLYGDFPAEDQIIGVDRVHCWPSAAIDDSTGLVYIVYQRNNAQGQGDIALQTVSTASSQVSSGPLLLDGNPGADRAQFMPWVTVDQATHRVHVLWYDEGHDGTGDVTELMHTYSTDQGATWSPPTPLFDRPFRGGYGNDTSEHDFGDYLQAVALGGTLHSVAMATNVLSQFNEGQPSNTSLFSPDVYYDQLSDAMRVAPLRLTNTQMTELCASQANGALEPGETGAFTFTLQNYVNNPAVGAATISGLSGTLTTTTPGVTITQATQSFPTLAPLATAQNGTPFLVKLDPTFAPGTYVNLLLAVQCDHGSTQLPYLLSTGAPGTATTLINENFNEVTPPALPAGWTSTRVGTTAFSAPAWVTSSTGPGGATAGNAAFHAEGQLIPLNGGFQWVALLSPTVVVPNPGGPNVPYLTLDFDVAYDTADDPSKLVQAFDGLCLRITDQTSGATLRSVLAEAIAEKFTTGASNGYPKHLPPLSNTAYFDDMAVWAGFSNGYVHVSMKFPGAGFVGRSIQLRFEWTQDGAHDCNNTDGYPGQCGVAIDNVVLNFVPTTGTFKLNSSTTATTLTTSANPAPQGSALRLTAHLAPSGQRGTVQFFDGTTLLGSASVSSDTAGISGSTLAQGTHSLTAQFTDACDSASTSMPVSQQITCANPGLVALWSAEGNANDVSGNNHNGVLQNGATYAPGKVGNAFSLNGVNANVAVPDDPAFHFTNAMSIEGWINTTASTDRYVATKHEDSFYFAVGGGAVAPHMLSFWLNGVTSSWFTGSTPVDDGQWHHVAATYDGATMKLYVDGHVDASAPRTGSIHSGTSGVLIGARSDGTNASNFPGMIDELAVYNRAIGPAEVQALDALDSPCEVASVGDAPTAARVLQLAPPWPNPAAKTMSFEFWTPGVAETRAEIIDVAGRRVSQPLKEQLLPGGAHRFQWDGRDASGARVASGVYLIRVTSGTATAVQRIVLVR